MKTLVLYTTCNGSKYEIRFKKFIRDGIFEDPNVKFIVIFNGRCSLDIRQIIPDYVLFVERPNFGFDFGAWSYAILNKNVINYEDYDAFIFLNASVYGPCLPTYLDKHLWTKCFTNKLNDKIKLVGCTENFDKDSLTLRLKSVGLKYDYGVHVQSYCWCIDKIFLKILIDEKYFNDQNKNRIKLFYILTYETQNVQLLKKYGYDYFTFEYAKKNPNMNSRVTENVTFNRIFKHFFQAELNPFERMFVKPDLNLDNNYFKHLVECDNIK